MTDLQQSFKAAPLGVRILLAAAPAFLVMSSGIALALQSAPGSTSGTASQLVALAKPGNVIKLPPAVNGETLNIINRKFQPAITIDLSRVSLSGIVIRNSSGIILKGGRVNGPGRGSYGISIRASKNIRVQRMTITGAHRGIVVNESTDVAIEGNALTGLIAEGINVALSQGVLISGNRCSNFNPTPATYSSEGKLIEDGDHPDCIQAWSRPTHQPTSDIRVIGNEGEGYMQGVFFGNHVRNGVDDGGFDRIVIQGNRFQVSMPLGIMLGSARDSIVRDNQISTVPGARLPKPPYLPVTANLVSRRNVNTLVCNNVVTDIPNHPASVPCGPPSGGTGPSKNLPNPTIGTALTVSPTTVRVIRGQGKPAIALPAGAQASPRFLADDSQVE